MYRVLGQAGMFQQPMGMYAEGQMGFQGQGGYSPMGGFRPKGQGFRGRMAKSKSMCNACKYRHWAGEAACLLSGGGARRNYPEQQPPGEEEGARIFLGRILQMIKL